MSSADTDGGAAGNRSLVRDSMSSGAGMAMALASGLLLDAVIALRFGAGERTDAFFVAARLPLGLNQLVLAGATQALTPAFARATSKRDWSVPSRVLVVLAGASLATAGLAAALARPLTLLTAPGLGARATDDAVRCTQILFLLVPLVLVAEVLRAVLNVQHRFGLAAFMNFVMNGVAIVLILGHHSSTTSLAWAYVIGGGAQLVYVLVLAFQSGFRFQPRSWGDGQAAAVGRLAVRPTAAAGVNLASRLGEQVALSFLPVGSVSIANYANRLISAIGGLFFRSATVAVLPSMARAAGEGARDTVRRLAHETYRIMVVISLPLTAFTVVLAVPAVSVVFKRGEFTTQDAHLVGLALMVYAISLVFSAAQRAILTTWLAELDTRMQLSSAVVGMVAEFALLAVLLAVFGLHQTSGVLAIALAWSLAQVAITAYCLRNAWRDHQLSYRKPTTDLIPWALVNIVAGLTMGMAYRVVHASHGHRWLLLAKGAGVASVGAIIMGGLGLFLFDRSDLSLTRKGR